MKSRVFETRFGRVEVFEDERGKALHKTFWGNAPCYWVAARGDIDAYFWPASADLTDKDYVPATIHQIQEYEDGTWTAWYTPGEEWFLEHAAAIIALGEWR